MWVSMGCILAGLVWQAAAQWLQSPLFPSPVELCWVFWDERSFFLMHAGYTASSGLTGLVAGSVLAMGILLCADYFPRMQGALLGLSSLSQALPPILLAPTLIVWFGFGWISKVLIVALFAFFPVLSFGVHRLDRFSEYHRYMSRRLKVGFWRTWFYWKAAFVWPALLAGLKVSISYAFVSATVGEWLGGSWGLGVVTVKALAAFRTDVLFVCALLVMLMSFMGFALLSYCAKHWAYMEEGS